jgi:FkbM family methyltransferase
MLINKASSPPVNRSWKGVVAFFLRFIIFAGVLFLCFEISVWIHPPMLAWGLGAIGRSSICGSLDSLREARTHMKVSKGEEDMVSQSKLVKTDGNLNLWRTSRGDWWVPKGSEGHVLGFLAQQTNKIYGEGVWGVRKGDVVLDAGANIGVYTREALDEGASLVIAIEPGPENVACLRRNLKREIEEKRVIVEPIGVWDKDDVLPLYADPLNSGADSFVIRGPNDRVIDVPLTSIDKLVARLQLPRIDFIKMDIKGATSKALTGAKGILASARPRLALSTEEAEDNPAEIRSVVLALQPTYQMACGICSVGSMRVNADVLLFRP